MFHSSKKKRKEKNQELVIKYIELILILLVSIGIMFGIRTWYLNDQEYKMTIPVLQGTVFALSSEELENYIYENENALLYVGVSSDISCRKLETELKPYIETHALKEKITYLNITNVKDKESFFHKFNETYLVEEPLSSYPSFVLFKNGKVESILSGDLTMEKVEKFLNENNIEGLIQ